MMVLIDDTRGGQRRHGHEREGVSLEGAGLLLGQGFEYSTALPVERGMPPIILTLVRRREG